MDGEQAKTGVRFYIGIDFCGINTYAVIFNIDVHVLVVSLYKDFHVSRFSVPCDVDDQLPHRLIEENARFVRQWLRSQIVFKVKDQAELFLKLITEPFQSCFQSFFIEDRRAELECERFCIFNCLLDKVEYFIRLLFETSERGESASGLQVYSCSKTGSVRCNH